MGKSLADAMNAQPGPDSLAYWLAPLKGYWDRQGRMAQQGLQMADEGAQAVRGGDFSGLGGALLGPVAYLSSPINALFPERSEVDAATDVPSWSKPLIAGGLETMAVMAPGPKGPKGLGRGMAELADDATDAERAALAGRLEAEATQTGTGAVPVSRDQALTNLVQGEPEGIIAYHGSPHTFDKFDMSKIGTGEGAQAYGHGLYFAENEGVARGYRDTLTKKHAGNPDHYDGMVFPPSLEKAQQSELNALSAKMRKDGNLPQSEMTRWRELKAVEDSYNNAVDAAKPKGSTYQVRINAKPDEFLDWDRPLSEQPKAIQDMLGSHPKSARLTGNDVVRGQLTQPTGEAIANRFGRTSDGAAQMKAAGIKGIRYKDQGSRGADGGTYNYVVFDDSIIDILKRYGIPMTAGVGGAMVVTGANMPPDLAAQMGPQA